MDALRQVRITHRGNYRHLLENVLISYRLAKLQDEDCTDDEPATASASCYSVGSNGPGTDSQAESEQRLAEVQRASEESERSDAKSDEKM